VEERGAVLIISVPPLRRTRRRRPPEEHAIFNHAALSRSLSLSLSLMFCCLSLSLSRARSRTLSLSLALSPPVSPDSLLAPYILSSSLYIPSISVLNTPSLSLLCLILFDSHPHTLG